MAEGSGGAAAAGGGGAPSMSGGAGDVGAGIGASIGGLLNYFFGDDTGGQREALRALEAIRGVPEPIYDSSPVTARDIQYLGPVSAASYDAALPGQVQLGEEGGTRLEQLSALRALEEIGRSGLGRADELAQAEAAQAVASASSAADDAVLRDFAGRGQGGSGQELAARLQAGRAQQALRGDLGRGLAQDALARRMQGLQGAAGLATDVRSQDEQRSAQNAQMANNFNQYISSLRTQARAQNAQAENAARFRNQDTRQGIESANQQNRQGVDFANRDTRNQLQDALSGFRLQQAGGVAGGYNRLGDITRGRESADRKNLVSIFSGLGQAGGSAAGAVAGMPGGGGVG